MAFLRSAAREAAGREVVVELHWHRPELFGEQERALADERIQTLARDHSDLIGVRISAKPTAHHRHGGQEVQITCDARGGQISASRTRPDLGLALNEALDAFEREVWRMRDRRAERRRA